MSNVNLFDAILSLAYLPAAVGAGLEETRHRIQSCASDGFSLGFELNAPEWRQWG